MTDLEYRSIGYILDNLEAREKRISARYIELNPDDAQRRQHDEYIYRLALHAVREHITELYKRKNA